MIQNRFTPGLSRDIARHLAETRYEDIPAEVRQATKLGILDTIAAAVAGSVSPVARRVARQLAGWGGRGESTLWVYGGRLPSPQAALANAMLAHTLDMDAVHDEAIVHAYTAVVPAALAAGEASQAGGRELIAAVALGSDFALRLGLACGFYRGFILTATLGGFGAAAAAGRVLGLDAGQMLDALGINYSQTAGNRQAFVDAASTTRYQPGFSARNGVLSACLAQSGLSGAAQALEGPFGYFNLYFEGEEPDLKALLDGLGSRYENLDISFKPYPSCRGAHAAVDGVLAILGKYPLQARQIERVVVRTPTSSLFSLIGRPFVVKPDPHIDAQYSIPYAVANAIVRRRFFVGDLREEAITDPAVLQMAARVEVTPCYDVPNKKALTPVEVEIELRSGAVYSERIEYSLGHPRNPLSPEALRDKFRRTVAEAGAERLRPHTEKIIDLVTRLETLPDVGELARLLG